MKALASGHAEGKLACTGAWTFARQDGMSIKTAGAERVRLYANGSGDSESAKHGRISFHICNVCEGKLA